MEESKNENSFLGKKHFIRITFKKLNNLSKNKKLHSIKGPWTYQEDLLLKNWVENNGPKSWRLCAKNIPGRNQSQCRQHWNNKLKPNILVGNWSSEEIFLIVVFYKKLNGSWRKIIPLFKSRTENSIKNIFFSQTRAIVSKINKGKNNKKICDLPTLLQYYDIIYEQTKKKFIEDNHINDSEIEEYLKDIENMLENRPKVKKFIDLDILRKKYNIKTFDESDDELIIKENLIDKNLINNKNEKNNDEIKKEETKTKSNKEKRRKKKIEKNKGYENNKNIGISFNQIKNLDNNSIINEKIFMDKLANKIFSNEFNNNFMNNFNNAYNGIKFILNYYIYYYNIINKLLSQINYNLYNYNLIFRLLTNNNNNINYDNILNRLKTNANSNANNYNNGKSNNINNNFSLNNNNENKNIISNININQLKNYGN